MRLTGNRLCAIQSAAVASVAFFVSCGIGVAAGLGGGADGGAETDAESGESGTLDDDEDDDDACDEDDEDDGDGDGDGNGDGGGNGNGNGNGEDEVEVDGEDEVDGEGECEGEGDGPTPARGAIESRLNRNVAFCAPRRRRNGTRMVVVELYSMNGTLYSRSPMRATLGLTLNGQ